MTDVSAALGLAAAKAGLEMGNVHIFDFYRDALGAIREEGLLRFLRRVATPYVSRAGRHFDPNVTTYTDRFLRWIDSRRGDERSETSRNPKSDVNLGKAREMGDAVGHVWDRGRDRMGTIRDLPVTDH